MSDPTVEALNVQRTSYSVYVTVEDHSGIERIRFFKGGSGQWSALGDGSKIRVWSATIEVERDRLDAIFTGAAGFFTPATVDIKTTDIHGNSNRQELSGPDTFGAAAGKYNKLPISPGKQGFNGWMGFSSGTTTVVGESAAGIAEMVKDPKGYVDQMVMLANLIKDDPAFITNLPQLMARQVREQHETRNPFTAGTDSYQSFGFGWSLGYATGTVAPAAASGGSSVLQKGLSSSTKLRRLVDAADSAVPDRVPNGVKPTALRRAGRIDNAVPDADVPTGRMSAKLNDMPGPRRQRTTEQFDQLDSDANDYLGSTDIDDPSLKAADLFENTGPKGRRALNDLAETDRDTADALMEIDDAATQRRFTEAYDSGDLDSDELGTALNRYDGLDSDGKDEFDDLVARNGDDAADFAARTDSDTFDSVVSPCSARGAPSLGGAGSLRTDRYHSVEASSSALVQSSGSCPDLPDDVEEDLQDALVNVDGDLDADEVDDVRRSINELDGDAQDSATNLIESEGTDGISVTNDVTDLSDGSDSTLTDREVDDLVRAYDTYSDKSYGRDVRDIQDDIDNLAENDVDGLADAINRGTSSSGDDISSNMKGLDGEVEVNSDLLDRDDVDADDLEMDKQIREDDSWETESLDSDDYNSNTDIDSDIDGGPAYEVKNLDYEPFAEFPEAYRETATALHDLRRKLNTFGASGQDEIIVVVRQDAETEFAPEVQNRLSGRLSGADSLRDLGDQVESNFDGVKVTFKRFGEVEST